MSSLSANQPESSSEPFNLPTVNKAPVTRTPGFILGSIAVGIAVMAMVVALGSILLQVINHSEPSTPGAPEGANDVASAPLPADRKFSGPDDIGDLVRLTAESVVAIYCGGGAGTGWIINTSAEPNVRPDRNMKFDAGDSTLVVTADHVIRECVKDAKSLEAFVGEMPVEVTLLNWHRKRDLALLAINSSQPGLVTTVVAPQGSWAMGVGFPWEFERTVPLIGRVIDKTQGEQYVDMAIQPGSSGSPIVNHKGQVIGTAVATLTDPEAELSVGWTVSVPTDVLCQKLFDCYGASITLTK